MGWFWRDAPPTAVVALVLVSTRKLSPLKIIISGGEKSLELSEHSIIPKATFYSKCVFIYRDRFDNICFYIQGNYEASKKEK